MNTRIRYIKVANQEHLLVTKEEFLGREQVLYAQIDTDTMSYRVVARQVDRGNEKIVDQGAAKTLAEVKKLVKAALKGLGVPFNDEVRNKHEVVVDSDSNVEPAD